MGTRYVKACDFGACFERHFRSETESKHMSTLLLLRSAFVLTTVRDASKLCCTLKRLAREFSRRLGELIITVGVIVPFAIVCAPAL